MALDASIKEILEADSTFADLMTGGIYCTDDADEIGRQQTPDAYDRVTSELLPCCFVRLESRVPDGPHPTGAVEYIAIYFYQRSGYASSNSAIDRAFTLLHEAKLAEHKVYQLTHTDDLLGQNDPHLGATLQMSRYMATKLRDVPSAASMPI